MKRICQWSWLVILVTVLSLVFAAGCGLAGKAVQPETNMKAAAGVSAPLTVKVLDVGQGDAILIRTKEQVTLIDSGDVPARDKLVSMLKNEGIDTIDKLIITHPHADHIGGVAALFDNFTIKQIYDSGQKTTTNLYKQYLIQIQKKKIPFTVVTAGTTMALGNDVILKVLAPETPFLKGTNSDLNNNSIVAKLIYRDFSMMLTGDAEKESEERMLANNASGLKSTILKSGHHGSSTSSSTPFLRAISPEVAVISVGLNNEYHHPHPSTLKKYNKQKIKVYRTDMDGTVTITTDGKTYDITKER